MNRASGQRPFPVSPDRNEDGDHDEEDCRRAAAVAPGTRRGSRERAGRRDPRPYLRLAALGSVSVGALLGHGARGLLHQRRCLAVPQLRAGPRQGLSLGRGRDRRHLRPLPALVLRAGVLERPGPAPQGAPVRRDGVGGQSRRGRQGVLLPFGQHADPLLHALSLQVSAAGISLSPADRGEPAPRRPGRRVRAARHRDLRSGPLLGHHRSNTPRPRPKTCASGSRRPIAAPRTPSCTSCRTCGSATSGRGAQSREPEPRIETVARRGRRRRAHGRRQRAPVGPEHTGALSSRRPLAPWTRGRGPAVHRQRDQRRARLRARPQVAQADHQGCFPSPALRRRSSRSRARARHQGRHPLPA